MGFWSGLKNFGTKILGGIKKAASWVAPTLNKVLGTLAGPVSTLHPGVCAVMGIGSRLAGGITKLSANYKKMLRFMQMTQQTTTIITSTNETFTIGTYNGFEIIIRDKDKQVNATKLVQLINERQNTNKLLKNITRQPIYREYKQFINEQRVGSEMSQPPLDYQLVHEYINEVRGTYVHKELVNIIYMKTSVKYLHHVNKIMGAINENNQQTHSNFEDNKDRIIEQLTHTLQEVEPRLVPKGREFDYIYSVVHDNDDIDGNSFKIHRLLKRSANCYPHLRERSTLFIDKLPVAATINYEIKQRLRQRNIQMKNLSFTIPKDQNVEDIMELIGQTVRDIADH
ncbi:MAG: hypothetical protein EZS28_028921 [Streblomastix strix]|uniref:KilA-N domain-containing protein n=1 Tax=Streblomastix strix TaxID=222440 RepID=A0A5J4UZH3_9EUKA|nr:MAG: hypothetical protein EZS28_028921 [Streblomastix strix]